MPAAPRPLGKRILCSAESLTANRSSRHFCRREITNLQNARAPELMPEGLSALAAKISGQLAAKSEVFLTHPAELRVLSLISDSDLRQFAAQHGWRVIRRVGGRQIEFYNDAGTGVMQTATAASPRSPH